MHKKEIDSMVKNFTTRFFSLLLAIAMFMTVPATAFAAESDADNGMPNGIPADAKVYVEEFDIEPGNEEDGIAPLSWESGEFEFSSYRRGKDYQFDGNYMAFEVTVTPVNNTPYRGDLDVRLFTYDKKTGFVRQAIVPANGQMHKEDWIRINNYASTPSTYYFYYYPCPWASDEPNSLHVKMVFYSWG